MPVLSLQAFSRPVKAFFKSDHKDPKCTSIITPDILAKLEAQAAKMTAERETGAEKGKDSKKARWEKVR
jgi:hypothetical protein